MTLASYTWGNQLRREIQTKLKALTNDCGETLTMKDKSIIIGEPIFTEVYAGRYHASKAKNEACPLVFMVFGETSLSGGNKNRTILQDRTLRCFILISKDFKEPLAASSAAIEDLLDYYRAKVVKVLNSCESWVDGRISMNVSGADDVDAISLMEITYRPPYYVSVIDASMTLASGQI